MEQQILTETKKAEIEAKVKATVDDAVRFAENSPAPDGATVAEYVFAPEGPIAIIGEPGAEDPRFVNALDRRTDQPFTTVEARFIVPEETQHVASQEAVGQR